MHLSRCIAHPYSQLTSVMDQDLPYLSKYEKPLKQCLNGGNCQEVRTLIGSIGKNPTTYYGIDRILTLFLQMLGLGT